MGASTNPWGTGNFLRAAWFWVLLGRKLPRSAQFAPGSALQQSLAPRHRLENVASSRSTLPETLEELVLGEDFTQPLQLPGPASSSLPCSLGGLKCLSCGSVNFELPESLLSLSCNESFAGSRRLPASLERLSCHHFNQNLEARSRVD